MYLDMYNELKKLEQYDVFKVLSDNKFLIKVDKPRIEKGLLVYSIVFFIFSIFVLIMTSISGAPAFVRLFCLMPLLFSFIFFSLYEKWYRFGQIVEINRDLKKLIIEDVNFFIFKSRKEYDFDKIEDFKVIEYSAYRLGSSPGAVSVYKGYCVRVIFKKEKVLWFIEKDQPYVRIGAYLKKSEALLLESILKNIIKN